MIKSCYPTIPTGHTDTDGGLKYLPYMPGEVINNNDSNIVSNEFLEIHMVSSPACDGKIR